LDCEGDDSAVWTYAGVSVFVAAATLHSHRSEEAPKDAQIGSTEQNQQERRKKCSLPAM